jgi:hypothetical protein
MQAASWCLSVLKPQARDSGWHQHGTSCSNVKETRSSHPRPLGVDWRQLPGSSHDGGVVSTCRTTPGHRRDHHR